MILYLAILLQNDPQVLLEKFASTTKSKVVRFAQEAVLQRELKDAGYENVLLSDIGSWTGSGSYDGTVEEGTIHLFSIVLDAAVD